MSQDLADFGERGPGVQHLGRQGVTELMRALRGSGQTRSLKPVPHDTGDGAGAGKATIRGVRPQEHAPACAARPSVPEVRGDRRASVCR